MAALGSRGRFGTIADAALIASIVIAPVAGGSVHPSLLPLLAALAAVAFGATLLGHSHAGRRQHLSLLPVGLLVASLLTLLQAIPIPAVFLSLISPRAHEVRTHVEALGDLVPVSYEQAATVRLAAYLAIYAMIAHVAYERASVKRGFSLVARALLGGALLSLVAAGLHRFTGSHRMLGIVESSKPASSLVTTFVNPNHGAGFMMLASLTAIGLAVSQRTRKERAQYLGAAILAACASVLCVSRGGLIALALGFLLFVLLLRRNRDLEDRRSNAPAIIGATIAMALAGFSWRYAELLREFTSTEEDPLGIAGKLAAMRDAGPLIADHSIFGIGRGSYGSVYPAYKTVPHQLTYTHPENFVIELLADWGVLLGSIAVGALVLVVFRRLTNARNVAVLGAMTGAAALLLQNLVDFSLEIPGVAIPVAALLGAAGVGTVKERRLELMRKRVLTFAAVPLVLLLMATVWAGFAPNLDSDLRTLADAAWSKDPTVIERLEPIARDHPANAVAAARVAFAAETADPPQLKTALRWANRTMFLAPTYADGHLVAGRLLLRFRYRTQGFTEMRRAWELARGSHRPAVIGHVIQLARSPEEILEAIPRRDEVMDEPEPGEIGTAALVLVERKKPEWAKKLLASVGKIESVPPPSLVSVAMAAMAIDDHALAESALTRRIEVEPNDSWSLKSLLEVRLARGDRAGAKALIAECLGRQELEPSPFLKKKLELAIAEGDIAEARNALEEIRRRFSPTQDNQIFLAKMKSKVERLDNHPAAAIRAMDDAIRLAPTSADLRVERATLLIHFGKYERARLDLTAALRFSPDHPSATALLQRLPPKLPGNE